MKNKANSGEYPKPELVFQNHNSWNIRHKLNHKGQFTTNLILKDKIKSKKLVNLEKQQ
jgi:hypothetical protein